MATDDRGLSAKDKAALHNAVRKCQYELIDDLLPRASLEDIVVGRGESILHLAIQNFLDGSTDAEDALEAVLDGLGVDFYGANGRTALHLSVMAPIKNARKVELVRFLMAEYKPNAMARSDEGITPLREYIRALARESNVAGGRLIDKSSSIVQENVLDIVGILLDNGADLSKEKDHGGVILLEAAKTSFIPLTDLLRSRGCWTATVDDDGNNWTLLYYLAGMKSTDMLKHYLELGEKIQTTRMGSPLNMAAGAGNMAAVKLLLDHGADIDSKGRHGATPLHEACRLKFGDMIKFLLNRGANVKIKTDNGNTPYDLYRFASGRDPAIIRQLRDR